MSYRARLKARAGRSIANVAVIVRQIISELARLNNLGQVTAGAAQRRKKRAAGVIEALSRGSEDVKRCC